jgi:tricorn protease
MRTLLLAIFVAAVPFSPLAAQPADEARLLRFPAIHGKTIAFGYAGNLYAVSSEGGIARRLTSHDGYEMFPRFSPDGKHLAFTGQYDGNTEVYVMPAEGGTPKRLTFTATLGRDEVSDRMGPNNIVMAWKNNNEIVFRSRMREWNDFIGQLYTVDLKGHLPEQLPLPRGGFCSFSPDGKKLAYNRVFREFRTWKRYRGGMADDVWIYDFDSKKTEAIAQDPASDVFPMWHGDKIYFLSDRDEAKRFNLWSYDTGTKKLQQLTTFKDYDCKYPSLGDAAIVFENAGYIYRFDLQTEKAAKVPIRILEDMASGRSGIKDVSKQVTAYEISPDGKRALFEARGELFTVPAKDGAAKHLTDSSNVHERNPKWSPDGKTIAFISDASGEDEIYVMPADGKGSPTLIPTVDPSYKYELSWSPDSKKLMWSDKKMRLHYVDVETKAVKLITQSKVWEIHNYSWSPDSKWTAFARSDQEGMPRVWIYSLEQDKTFAVTDGWHDSSHPVFSGDGKYLYFASERNFDPVYSETEWNHAYVDMDKLYVVLLSKETANPFRPKSEDEPAKEEKKDGKDKKEEGKEKKKDAVEVKIDLEGLKDRVLELPTPAGRYRNLQTVGANLYYQRMSRKGGPAFAYFDLAAKKETNLGTIGSYEISANGQKMIVSKDGSYYIIDLPKAAITLGEALSLSGLQVNLDRRKEWNQIFHESWRQMRDFFYDPGMHGVDWKATKAKYEVLLPHVNHRADLTYIIGEMISDLNAGHAYVGGGELPKVAKVQTGLLGAELTQDPKTGAVKIAKILKGVSWDKTLRSPLAEVGVNVEPGEYIVAVDGKPTKDMANIYEALVNTVGKQVRLTINKEPSDKGAREVVVTPIADEHPLYYHQMVQNNIKKVADASGGKIGYLHVPDMSPAGLNEFAKHFYPQLRKKALIVDVRGNGGGNVSPMLIERLRREIAMVDISRDTAPKPDPFEVFLGPVACLLNEFSASDGDIFPYRFRHYKLGKLIGKRSWGGTIGIRGSLPFVDGGTLSKPEFASYTLDGKSWAIEGHGVDPDIVVDNDPAREYAGADDQLNRAVEHLLEELRTRERQLPPPPPFPKR